MARYKGEKGKAWKAFSDYVRYRDQFTCYTCDKVAEGVDMHAGHYIPVGLGGSNSLLSWDEKNVYAQCMVCNVRLSGWGERFRERLGQRRPDLVAELDFRRGSHGGRGFCTDLLLKDITRTSLKGAWPVIRKYYTGRRDALARYRDDPNIQRVGPSEIILRDVDLRKPGAFDEPDSGYQYVDAFV